LKIVESIEALEKHNIKDTACKPILVFCSDLEFYYCKYNTGFSSADRLLREYLSACFLEEWKLAVPDFAFIRIKKEHILSDLGIPFRYFDSLCFGSRKIENAAEVTRFITETNQYQKRKFINLFDYLRIALFDIWVANDDRNHNNYNLLIQAEEGKYRFVPIDHEAVFNSGNIDKPLYTISENSSLITAPLCLRLFSAKELSNKGRIDEMKDYFYLCVINCKQKLPQIINNVPEDWKINLALSLSYLENHLFVKKWIDECWDTFVTYLQFTINKLSSA